ncbi:hypothetical protein [uncultured Desulfosarcina sp.]|uniref:hypothetical protein n=1 Tax=uncultured Desulfosarcina sp. TaxID=218289 RepID=UPI0029C6401E|nr:hypothetical protein [uncultured Desulfosarcina sp.]
MKKVRLLIAVCAALMIAAPAMALEVEVSGHYYVEHYNNSNFTLQDSDATDDYSDMEFMAKPVFKINDNITLTTQFTALQGHVAGTDASGQFESDNPLAPKMDNSENFDWKAAYMTIKTGIGGFIIGRYIDTPWGTALGDSTASHGSNSLHKDRIMWVVPVGNFISGLVAQENNEYDLGNEVSDADFYKYYGFSAYKQENWSTGLLIANYQHKNFVTQGDLRAFQRGYTSYQSSVDAYNLASATFGGNYNASLALDANGTYTAVGLTAAANAAGYDTVTEWDLNTPGSQISGLTGGAIPIEDLYAYSMAADAAQAQATYAGALISNGPTRSELNLWVFDPYFMGTFGGLSIETELLWGKGTIDLDETRTDPVTGQTFNDMNATGLAATIDLKYDIAGFTLNGGYTYVQGDSNYTDDETNAIGYLEPSLDLEHGFLLTSDTSGLETSLGGTDADGIPLGNLAGGPTTLTGTAGYQMFWLGGKYAVLENLTLGVLYVKSKADDAPLVNPDSGTGPQWDDDHGQEYDFTVDWDIMDNLTFNGVIAHLAAGDYWKKGDPTADIKDNTTFYGCLTVEF